MKKRRKSLILSIAVGVFIFYIAASLISLQLQISKEKTLLANLKEQYQKQVERNAEIERILSENDRQYIESVARDKLGYAKPSERIYFNIPGN